MRRRTFVLAALACPARAEDEAAALPRQKISAAQLYEALGARFPLRATAGGGLLALQLSAPRLLLRPARNELGATLRLQVDGLQAAQAQAGEMDLLFALRYEAADQTVRGHDPEIPELRWPGLPPQTLQALQAVLPALARQLGELVLHRFSARELALPDTMGFEPRDLRVADDGVEVVFGPKRTR